MQSFRSRQILRMGKTPATKRARIDEGDQEEHKEEEEVAKDEGSQTIVNVPSTFVLGQAPACSKYRENGRAVYHHLAGCLSESGEDDGRNLQLKGNF